MHRVILNSDAYKMSSKPEPRPRSRPTRMNDRLWRFDMRRLTAEEIRDSILAVTGDLEPRRCTGRASIPRSPPRSWPASRSREPAGASRRPRIRRRSVYVHVKRSLILPILESFDLAETDRSSPVRFATTQPTQALGMLNGTFMNRQARQRSRRPTEGSRSRARGRRRSRSSCVPARDRSEADRKAKSAAESP